VKFVRTRLAGLDPDTLRTVAARQGWLVETPEVLRAGFGSAVAHVDLREGLNDARDANELLGEHQLTGDPGPAGSGVVAFGTLPFDRARAGELDVARFLLTRLASGDAWVTAVEGDDAWREMLDVPAPTQETQSLRSLTFQPTPEEYAHHVARAVEILRRKEIDKVVLARAVLGTVPEPVDAAALATRLKRREPLCTIYSLPTDDGRRFVGASPELLVARLGHEVTCHPLAGTIALAPNVAPDDYATWLLGSTKNLHEHSLVVDEIVENLSRFFEDIHADAAPSVVTLRSVAHLGTWIRARAGAGAPDALALVRSLHPTAAVGGLPRDRAQQVIAQLEQHDRGHFAGPVGWMDANGDGEWWLGLRGVLLDGRNFEAWAGAGIVSESDPVAEREETKNKLAVILSSLLADAV